MTSEHQADYRPATAHEQAQPARTVAPRADTPGVIAPPPLIYLGALGVGFGLNAVIGGAFPAVDHCPAGQSRVDRRGHRAPGDVRAGLRPRPDTR
jgi:hypothetical protein